MPRRFTPRNDIFGLFGQALISLFLSFSLYAEEATFTQKDREMVIRKTVKLEELEKSIDARFKSIDVRFKNIDKRFENIDKQFDRIDKQFDDMKTFMLWGFGILFGGMGLLIGLVIWNRWTALSPVIRNNKELTEQEERVEKVLKEYGRVGPKFANILKSIKL